MFNPEDFRCTGSYNRISSFNVGKNGNTATYGEWAKSVADFLPHHILLNNQQLGDSFHHRRWISSNCNYWWTNSNLTSSYLLRKNKDIPEVGGSHTPLNSLLSIVSSKDYYLFEDKNDAIIFRLYAS